MMYDYDKQNFKRNVKRYVREDTYEKEIQQLQNEISDRQTKIKLIQELIDERDRPKIEACMKIAESPESTAICPEVWPKSHGPVYCDGCPAEANCPSNKKQWTE